MWQSSGQIAPGSRPNRDTCATALFMAYSAMRNSKFKIPIPSYRTPKNTSKQVLSCLPATRRQTLGMGIVKPGPITLQT